MKLIDRITHGERFHAPAYWSKGRAEKTMPSLASAFCQATVVDVQNVAEYYTSQQRDDWYLDEHFQGITPPFEYTWLEARIEPNTLDPITSSAFRAEGWNRWGACVVRRDVRAETIRGTAGDLDIDFMVNEQYVPPDYSTYGVKGTKTRLGPHGLPIQTIKESELGARWQFGVALFFARPTDIWGPVIIASCYLDALGNPLLKFGKHGDLISATTSRRPSSFCMTPSPITSDEMDDYIDGAKYCEAFINTAYLALSFMNCRNVRLREDAPPPKLAKKHEKKYGKGLVTSHVIEIQPIRVHSTIVAPSRGSTRTTTTMPSLHIRRGHFKHFGEQYGTKKLFGRIEGKFWW
jgi:hypothetical protein